MGVLTGAIAIIKSNGIPIGKMRNVRVTETIRRQDVRGIGRITVAEAPAIEHGGQITCGWYEINFNTTGVPNAIRRDVQTTQEFEDNVLLDDEGVQIDIYKKVSDLIDPNTGLRTAKLIPHAVITRCLIEQEDLDINEGQVSGHNQNFKFLDPITYPS
jgi:hypothetical protein